MSNWSAICFIVASPSARPTCEEVVPDLDCDFVATGQTIDDVHAAMMEHGGANHADLMDGKSPAEMQPAGAEISIHIRQLVDSR